jgi:predicted transcriptional regulator
VNPTVGRKRQYRSRIQIAADILSIVKNGSHKTRIMYLGNLSFELLQKYLALLADLGLIEAQNRNEKTYTATEKGRQFLEDFSELQKHSEVVEAKKRSLERSLSFTA